MITLRAVFQPSQSHCSDAVASAIPVVVTMITLRTVFQPSQSHCSDAVASAIPVVIIHGLSEQHRHFHFVTAPELGLVGLADKLKLGRGRVGAAVFLAGAARGAPVLVRAAARA